MDAGSKLLSLVNHTCAYLSAYTSKRIQNRINEHVECTFLIAHKPDINGPMTQNDSTAPAHWLASFLVSLRIVILIETTVEMCTTMWPDITPVMLALRKYHNNFSMYI